MILQCIFLAVIIVCFIFYVAGSWYLERRIRQNFSMCFIARYPLSMKDRTSVRHAVIETLAELYHKHRITKITMRMVRDRISKIEMVDPEQIKRKILMELDLDELRNEVEEAYSKLQKARTLAFHAGYAKEVECVDPDKE